LREERWQRVFKNRVLRKISEPKGDELIGEWRKLYIQYNEQLNELYPSINIIRIFKSIIIKWAGNVARMRERMGCIQGFGGET
jgi:hypothetical protein